LSDDSQNPVGLTRRSESIPKNPVATELSRCNNGLDLALIKTVLQEGYLGMSFDLKPLKTQIQEEKIWKTPKKNLKPFQSNQRS